jgi:RNA polymerase sigma-70 factor (ECF subfamily)
MVSGRSWCVNGQTTSAALVVREERPMAQAALVATETAAAFEEFFEEERTPLFLELCLMTGNPGEAEEIAQDAFLHLWERWDRVREMESPAGYLYRSAMNGFRSRRRRVARAGRNAFVPVRQVDAYEEADLRDSVLRALDKLGRRQRAAIVLTELLGYDSAEAGRLLDIKATTVRTLASEARATLRNELEPIDA